MAEEQSASARIAELLRHHDDLEKVATLKSKLQKEKAVVDGQLKAGVQAQIASMLKGMERLQMSKQNVDSVRDNMDKVDKIRVESTESVENFDKINRVSRVLQNFEDTQRFIDNFQNMNGQLQEIQQMMTQITSEMEDQDGEFFPGALMENLVVVHYKLSQLLDVKDDSWYYAQRSTDDVRRTIKKHFAPLDSIVEQFDTVVMDIATQLLDVIRAQNPSLVVRTAKIIDHEEKQDLASTISKEISQDEDSVLANLKKKTASHRQPREYPKRFFATIEQGVKQTFANCKDYFGDDIDSMLGALDWIFSDLGLVQIELSKCMPSRWKIFDRYVGYYHYQTYELLNYVLDKDPNAASILLILQYVKDYYEDMNELGVTKDKLQPPLLDGRENKLYDEYLSLIVGKLREWKNNLSTTEKTNFVERQVAPETDADGKLGLEGEVVMFSIVSQQIDVAADSGQGRILAGCVEECANILLERQREWEQVMKQQVSLQVNDTAVDDETSQVPGGLVEYLIALGNDQIKGADYTEAISSRIAPKVSKKYRQSIQSNLDRVCDGFIALAKSCISGLITIIFTDLVSPFKEMFNSSAWLKGRPTRQIVDTVQEYMTDCESQLNPIIFEVFSDDLLEETVLRYLGALNDCDKIKNKGIERIEKDIEELYVLFTGGVFAGDEEHAAQVQAHFRIFGHFMSTLGCQDEQDELLGRFREMRNDFWDAPLDLFQSMVKARHHMDKQRVKDIMREVRQDALQNQQPPESGESTFLARFSL